MGVACIRRQTLTFPTFIKRKKRTMAINYAVSKCKNPNGVAGVEYFSCKARKTSDYTFKELAADISLATTCTKADALAVLGSIKPFIEKALLAGRRVVLEDLGSFVIGIRSKCFTPAQMLQKGFSTLEQIKGYSIRFRPEQELSANIATGIAYNRVETVVTATGEPAGDGNGSGGDDGSGNGSSTDSENPAGGSDNAGDGSGEAEQIFIGTSVNDPAMGSVSGMGTYDKGTTVTLTATANAGYRFVRWSDDVTDNPRTVTADVNGAAYTAVFEAE